MAKLNAWLRPNHLTEDKGDYMAVPQATGSLNVNDLVADLQQEGMEIKTETAVDIITRFNRKAAERVLSGYNVNTGLVYMRPVIKGVFRSKAWDAATHSVYVAINQGMDLRRAVAGTTVTILGEQADPLAIYSITDSTTGATDGTLTKGRNAELRGSYLKIAGENPANGVLLRNTNTQEEIRLSPMDIVLNEPSRLLILMPAALAEGEYELTVTTQYSGGNTVLKQPRSVSYNTPIVIA